MRPLQNLPSPHGHGWVVEADKNVSQIHVCWMTQPPAPKDLMELVSCKCIVGCATHKCSCFHAVLCCTDACGCRDNCKNSGKQTASHNSAVSAAEPSETYHSEESDRQSDDNEDDDSSDSDNDIKNYQPSVYMNPDSVGCDYVHTLAVVCRVCRSLLFPEQYSTSVAFH